MEVFKVEYYEFWDKEEDGSLDRKTVAAEDAEEAIIKVKKLILKQEWIDDEVKPPLKHKVTSVEIHQVLHETSLDG